MTKDSWILDLALRLNRATNHSDRFDGLIATFRRFLPFDAACLFVKEGDSLRPVSITGLVPETMYRMFKIHEHPRLETIVKSHIPVIFPANSLLPDPFDGLVAKDHSGQLRVHSCMGCPLIIEDEMIGILTADALSPSQFDSVDLPTVQMIAALAAAALRTSLVLERLEEMRHHERLVNQDYTRQASDHHPFLGESPAIEKVRRTVELVAPTDLSVLITGETGTGKEVIARQVHMKSRRHNEALVYVNCAALPESLAESEFFGHKRGAFTGAHTDRTGKLEMAHRGTIFLDEIGELSLSLQSKLLRFLQEGEIQKVGSDQIKKVDVRVLAATNRNLQIEIENGRFRMDLFHRLAAYPLWIPPLRERQSDALLLAQYFCNKYQKKFGTAPIRSDESFREVILESPWLGNVRELKNAVARAVLRAQYRSENSTVLMLTRADLDLVEKDRVLSSTPKTNLPAFKSLESLSLREATTLFQKQFIHMSWLRHNQNWSRTAQALGMHRANLHQLAKRLDLIKNRDNLTC